MIHDMIEGLKDAFFTFLYLCFKCTCQLIDFIKDIFYLLCGIDPVTINGEKTDVLSSLLTSDSVKRAFLLIFLIGIILLIAFTVIAILKTSYQEKRSLTSVLKKSGESFLIALLIPFTVLAGVALTNTVMSSINAAMNPYGETAHPLIGGQFLATIAEGCYKGSEEESVVLGKFVTGELDYRDVGLVKSYFDIQGMNYLIGIIGAFVMLVMFVLSSLTFIQRIFDVVLLYLVSPISIATIPLDEGNRFKIWKDMMIGKILSAYGVILTMNLFFLIIPQVYSIKFFDSSFQNGVVYILFLLGGSFAVSKSNDIIARLCGSDTGRNEFASMVYNMRSGIALAHAVNHKVGGAMGRFVGGSAYNKARAKGSTRKEALMNASKAKINPHKAKMPKKPQNKARQILGKTTRFATMPAGMIHDLAQGGVIAVGKNFSSRLNNAMHGTSLVNHNDQKPKADKAKARTEASGGKPEGSVKRRPKPNSVMRRDDSERRIIRRGYGRRKKH